MIICYQCGHQNQDYSNYCDNCGTKILPLTAESALPPQPTVEKTELDMGLRFKQKNLNQAPVADAEMPTELNNSLDKIAQLEREKHQEIIAQSKKNSQQPAPNFSANYEPTIVEDFAPKINSEATVLETIPASLILKHETSQKTFTIPLTKQTIILGRLNDDYKIDVDLGMLPHSDVISRRHFYFHVTPQGYYIEDAGSSNGTFLNNQELKKGGRALVKSGDQVILGRKNQVKFIVGLLNTTT